ncbi:RagB/SusD family nutrient uptake outer membrane protein [Alistipes sp. OttesenSCG-928-B03]|nr:RagB/SusD family nutrient uptake outer membrane protein [Alistipes sp. OttesenSCG-928-B03]
MKRYIALTLLMAVCLGAVSCEGWLDVKPKSMTPDEELFSREDGFKEALTGAYILAAKKELYGTTLSIDFLEGIAQRYNTMKNGEYIYQDPLWYDFTTSNKLTSDYTNKIWENMYRVISNINNMLSWLEKNRSVLVTDNYYEIMRGEGLALRSYLYFDLLRMYGPVHSRNPKAPSIVYRTQFDREAKSLVPADEMLGYIIADLKEAEELLADTDPLDFEYSNDSGEKVGPADGEDGFLIFRFKRMNLMAVKALLARVYLWSGSDNDRLNANTYAREVIKSEHFSLGRSNTDTPILPSEIIFGVHVDDFETKVTDEMDKANSPWRIQGDNFFAKQFTTSQDGGVDWRLSTVTGFSRDGQMYTTLKYKQSSLPYSMGGTIPLIRLAEMYFILIETEKTLTSAGMYLNEFRDSRGNTPLTLGEPADLDKQLAIEYSREFYAEGQLWYFYKRNFTQQIANSPLSSMTDSNYTFPIPDDELKFGAVGSEEE